MNNVVNLHSREQQASQRAEALLGNAPLLTLHAKAGDDPARCSVQLLKCEKSGWLGVLRDHSQFLDRVRMGVAARFVLVPSAEVATVCGDAEVQILGRIDDNETIEMLQKEEQAALQNLLKNQPFSVNNLVAVRISPNTIEIEAYEEEFSLGGIPRT